MALGFALERCEICGGEAAFRMREPDKTGKRIYVECRRCGARVLPFYTEEAAAAEWNGEQARRRPSFREWEVFPYTCAGETSFLIAKVADGGHPKEDVPREFYVIDGQICAFLEHSEAQKFADMLN